MSIMQFELTHMYNSDIKWCALLRVTLNGSFGQAIQHLATERDDEGYEVEDDVDPALQAIMTGAAMMYGNRLATHPDFSEDEYAPC